MEKLCSEPIPDFVGLFGVPADAVSERQIYASALRYGEANADDMAFVRVQRGFFLFSIFFFRRGFEVKGYESCAGEVVFEFFYRENGFVIHRQPHLGIAIPYTESYAGGGENKCCPCVFAAKYFVFHTAILYSDI